MVSQLEGHLGRRGLGMIAPEVGRTLLLDELRFGRKGDVEVIYTGGLGTLEEPLPIGSAEPLAEAVPMSRPLEIAIVGMGCRFPGAGPVRLLGERPGRPARIRAVRDRTGGSRERYPRGRARGCGAEPDDLHSPRVKVVGRGDAAGTSPGFALDQAAQALATRVADIAALAGEFSRDR